ncbi:MAG: hypothetical protein HWD59_14820 [Coxiellaceae bacterium]|nr:MAG: hypothetical protein HWD59_14820 [Coxiellaceae bacterium]
MVGTPFPDDLTTHAHFDPTDKLVFDDATTSFKEDDSKKLEAATNLNSEDLMTTFYQVNNPFVNLNKTSREDASSSSDTENSIESDKRISSVELLNNFAIDPKKTSFQKIKSENKKAAENPASLGRMAAIRAFPHMTPMKKAIFLLFYLTSFF